MCAPGAAEAKAHRRDPDRQDAEHHKGALPPVDTAVHWLSELGHAAHRPFHCPGQRG